MKEKFKAYLISRGYSEFTPSGQPSTVYDYARRIDYVCEWENMNWEMLKAQINRIVPEYDKGGAKEHLGNKSHKAVINALLRFQEFAQEIATIRKYVEKCGGSYDRHEASVGASVNGKDQHGIRMVFVEVTDDNAKVIIEDLHTICDHRTNTFTPENATFSIINKTLQIRPIDSLCGRIVIEVTAQKQ